MLRGRGGNDNLNGGGGTDIADYSQATAGVKVRLDLGLTLDDGEGGADTLVSIESLTGSQFNDVMVGNSGNNVIRGGLGSDVLLGGAGDDVISGGEIATNEVHGGLGNDYFILDSADTVIEYAGEGIDTVEARISTYTLANNVENLIYTGPASFSGWGNGGDNRITGGVANDYLHGMGGNDTIDGGQGSDTLYLRGLATEYTITQERGGYRILDSVAGRDGSTFVTSIEQLQYSNNSIQVLTYSQPNTSILPAEKDAGLPQVSRILDDADTAIAKTHGDVPLVQPGSLDDGFMNLKLDSDSVGPQIQPGMSDDLSGFGSGSGGGQVSDIGHGAGDGSGWGDASGLWGMDPDIQRALDDHAARLQLHNQTASHDPWG